MSEAPKRSRLRRRAAAEEEEVPTATAPGSVPVVEGQESTPEQAAERDNSRPGNGRFLTREEKNRLSPRNDGLQATEAPLERPTDGNSPRFGNGRFQTREEKNKLSPRSDGAQASETPTDGALPARDVVPSPRLNISAVEQPDDAGSNNQPTDEPVHQHEGGERSDAAPEEEQEEEPEINREPAKKHRGFHFRRNHKGREEVPTSEEAVANAGPRGTTVEDHRGVRPMPRYLQYSMFDCLLQSNLMFGLGYNVSKFQRHRRFEDVNPGLRLEADADGLAVGVTVQRMNTYGVHLIGIVKPLVKVHAVSLSTGYYIRSRNLPAVIPVTTTPCALLDATTHPTWNQELVLNAYFSDVVADDTLLLFEILDDKPTFRVNYADGAEPIAKRVAWGYLLPIGVSGEMNVGFSEDWKFSERRKLSRGPSRRRRAGEGGANAESTGELDPIDEDEQEDKQSVSVPGREAHAAAILDDAEGVTSSEPAERAPKSRFPWHKPSVDKTVRVQLYSYRQYDGVFGLIQRKIKGWPTISKFTDNGESSYPDGVPEVYVQWRLQRLLPLAGAYLSVKLGPRPAETMPILLNSAGLDGVSSPMGDRSVGAGHDDAAAQLPGGHYLGRRGRLWAGAQGLAKNAADLTKLRTALLKRTRGNREPCVVPDKLLQRIDVGGDGALVVSFSHSGHILAIASKTSSPGIPLSTDAVLYSITLYDTDLREEVWVESAAHHGPIYELKWSRDDQFLLSCSGDGTCKVWDMLPVSYRSSNTMGFGALNSSAVGRVNGSFDPSIQATGARPPGLLHTLVASPPVYTYTGVFQDQAAPMQPRQAADTGGRSAAVPRIITGAADGKLRVWDGGVMVGYVVVTSKDKNDTEAVDYSPHEGQINSIVIDERSRYMITGDSCGDIFAWRCDAKGWYQLLRKFKRDSSSAPGAAEVHTGSGVLSLAMHPDKHKGQLLALLRQPAQLKVINLNTYKTHCVCAGYSGYTSAAANAAGGIFCRAQFSADGRYAVAGASVKAEDGLYRLQVWETSTGHVVRTPLSDMMFPYPVRSVSWHPAQHLLAVSMVGHGAAVILYTGDRESADKASERMGAAAGVEAKAAEALTEDDGKQAAGDSKSKVRDSYERRSGGGKVQFSGAAQSQPARSQELKPLLASDSSVSLQEGKLNSETSKLLQSDKAREMLERIRAAKAAKLNA